MQVDEFTISHSTNDDVGTSVASNVGVDRVESQMTMRSTLYLADDLASSIEFVATKSLAWRVSRGLVEGTRLRLHETPCFARSVYLQIATEYAIEFDV